MSPSFSRCIIFFPMYHSCSFVVVTQINIFSDANPPIFPSRFLFYRLALNTTLVCNSLHPFIYFFFSSPPFQHNFYRFFFLSFSLFNLKEKKKTTPSTSLSLPSKPKLKRKLIAGLVFIDFFFYIQFHLFTVSCIFSLPFFHSFTSFFPYGFF